MAQSRPQLLENQHQQDPPFSFDDSLYCREEHLEEELREDCCFEESYYSCFNCDESNEIELPNRSIPHVLIDHDLFCEDHELSTLLSKEEGNQLYHILEKEPSLAMVRSEAVEWMLRVHAHYSFSLLTALLAVNYFDRFFSGFKFQRDKPWLTQLAAVACLSLAAKVEETHVPLLVDLQVEETKYLFEAKTIHRMEILVLSTLEWKMNRVTPYSFLDYMAMRLGLKDHLCRELLRRCEMVLLATVSDSRFMAYLPSVVATAIMLHVINSIEPSVEEEYQNQFSGILGIDKDKVEECEELILKLEVGGNILLHPNKRKLVSMPRSPNAVIDVSFSSDSSNDSWAVTSTPICSSLEALAKKIRIDQDQHLETIIHL